VIATVGVLLPLLAVVSSPLAATDLTVEITAKRDGSSTAVKGATVSISEVGHSPTKAKTGASGKAVFTSLPEGTATVTVSAPGFGNHTSDVELQDNQQTLRVTLVPPLLGQLTITVLGVDEDTTIALKGAHTKIKSEQGTTTSLPPTDEDGAVIAKDLPFGKWTITVIAAGWETDVDTFELKKPKAKLEIRLSRQQPPGDGS